MSIHEGRKLFSCSTCFGNADACYAPQHQRRLVPPASAHSMPPAALSSSRHLHSVCVCSEPIRCDAAVAYSLCAWAADGDSKPIAAAARCQPMRPRRTHTAQHHHVSHESQVSSWNFSISTPEAVHEKLPVVPRAHVLDLAIFKAVKDRLKDHHEFTVSPFAPELSHSLAERRKGSAEIKRGYTQICLRSEANVRSLGNDRAHQMLTASTSHFIFWIIFPKYGQ